MASHSTRSSRPRGAATSAVTSCKVQPGRHFGPSVPINKAADTPSQHLFTPAQLSRHRDGPWERGSRTPSRQLAVKLAALPASLDISFPQPRLDPGFTAPEPETSADATLLLRLLQLSPSRALPLARLTEPEKRPPAGSRQDALRRSTKD